MSDEELEAIRKRKMASLQEEALREQVQENAIVEAQAQKDHLLRHILTPEARARLSNIRMVKPQFAEQLEMQLIQLSGTGRLKGKVTDEQLKELLVQLQEKERERKVTFR